MTSVITIHKGLYYDRSVLCKITATGLPIPPAHISWLPTIPRQNRYCHWIYDDSVDLITTRITAATQRSSAARLREVTAGWPSSVPKALSLQAPASTPCSGRELSFFQDPANSPLLFISPQCSTYSSILQATLSARHFATLPPCVIGAAMLVGVPGSPRLPSVALGYPRQPSDGILDRLRAKNFADLSDNFVF